MGSTGSSTSVSLQNNGTVSVLDGVGEDASPSNFYAGNTSVTNTGEIEVIGSSFSVASVTNTGTGTGTGTFKVEGTSKLEIGTLSGTITLAVIPANDNNPAVNPTLNASSITGGGTNGGTLTAQGDLTFTGANTLNGVALNATGKTVTVGNNDEVPDSLTVKGTSTLNIGTLSGTIKTDANELTTLNASSISGGSIYAQNNLKFTGANTLNSITLDASGKTVTVGTDEDDSLTVGGTSTLNIGTLDGEIKTAASTTLQNSNITGGGTNGGTITAQGAIRVNNSTITSSTFTAITVNGVDFYGENTLDGVTLDTGVWGYVYIDTDGTLTIKGKSTLKTPSLQGSRTIKLDGAEIVDSWIGGHQTNGGTLVVESGKTATFSTTGSNSNDFGRTSIDNSGTINVNGLLSLSTTTGTINNSGTINVNVNGRLTTGTIDNSGTIALNGGATVSSTISGGSITTSNTGTVTVHDSTISSSAFTATADEVIFYYRNTLNGVTLDATGKTVTVNGTLTVKGTSTLNATNITGGTISAQDNLTFTGTNTLNGVTLDATGNTVTIGNGDEIADSLTVKGTNTLNIGTLNGTIKTDADALTTLNASSITGGSISAQNSLTFTGSNTLNGVTLDATDKTVTVNGTLTVGGTSSTLNIGTLDGTIRTASGAKLTGSRITGGGTNGGKIIALGTLTFDDYTHLRNITLDAHDQTVDTTYDLWLGGTITLDIDTLINKILVDEPTTFVNSTISKGNSSSQLYIYGSNAAVPVTFAGRNTIFDASAGATGTLENYGTITVESRNNVKGELSACRVVNRRSITVGSDTDACSLSVTDLTNNKTVSVTGIAGTGQEPSVLSSLSASGEIVNNEKMTLTYSEVSASRLINTAPGTFVPAPDLDQSKPGLAISNSTVSIVTAGGTGLLRNGADNNTSATTDISNSTVTADSVANYGTHNGTDGNTGIVGFAVTDSTFTVNGEFRNTGWVYVINSTLQAASVVNNGNRFWVYGTSTLDIDSLEGTITIGKHTGYEDPVTLNNSLITGKVNDNGTLGSSISVTNPLTFTGTNTLTNVALATTNCGAVTVGDSDPEADSLTLTNSTVGCTVKVQSGATLTLDGMNTITTLDLSEASEGSVTMDWQDQLSFTGFGDSYENKLTINVDSYTSGDLSTPILDYTGTGEWTEDMYKSLLKTAWSSDLGSSTRYEFVVRDSDLYIDVKEIVVKDGTYDTITVLNGIESTIEDGAFERGVMGGELVTEADAVNVGDISMTVNGGTYEKLLGAGDCVNPNVSGANSSAIRCAGFSGTGSEISYQSTVINFAITNGTFTQHVAGGMEYMDTTPVSDIHELGRSTLYGDINLNISGGEFQQYLYGGSVAANKSLSGCTEIFGDVTITIDATDPATGTKTIILNKVVCGSYNVGTIDGSTKLVLTGNAANLDFISGGEIWGGCGGDYYKAGDPGEREFQSNVTGSRTLSFTGFSGILDADCARIRGFSDIEFLDNSNVTFDSDGYSMSDVKNWTFEYDAGNLTGSSLTGSFLNNFTGDTLILDLSGLDLIGLTPEAQAAWKWTLLTNNNSEDNVFKGFGGTGDDDLKVFLKNGGDPDPMGWNESCYAGGGYKLALENESNLVLTLA